MSFAENARKIMVDTADNVVKASGEFYEKSKLKYKIYDAGIDRKRLLAKLGKLTYNEFLGQDADAEKKEQLCEEIRDIESYINGMKEKLNK